MDSEQYDFQPDQTKMRMVLPSFIGLDLVGKMHGPIWLRALTLSYFGA
ncbi:hypothetical protein VCHA34P121_40010 [Vibrio chagasii]|nr:hypothetical protein VCHA34P121_40010 [Vibrio chagasii]